jgi:hypothetical protein
VSKLTIKPIRTEKLLIKKIASKCFAIFKKARSGLGIDFVHQENDFIDIF